MGFRNTFSLLILVLILFLFPIIGTADKPVNAVKFVILKPIDSTVNTPITVTIEAQKSNNKIDDSCQNDVILVASGSATGGGFVDIIDGRGSLQINDLVAETVILSLSEIEPPTGLDISSTQQVIFTAPTDTTAPSTVSDLIASNPTTSSITLTWTSPGDDGSSGTAATYDVRYRTNTINHGNWSSSDQVNNEPVPQIAGTVQSMTISGLSTDTIYSFAIETSDEALNTSEISNVVSMATTSLPPSSPSADLSIIKLDNPDPIIAGDTLTYIITVTNNGPNDTTNVVVSDTLPLALVSPSLSSSQGACVVFPCNLGTIASNNSANITIISPIDSSITGTITNIASVSSDVEDPVSLNDVSTQETTISSSPEPEPEPESIPLGGGTAIRPTTVAFSGIAFPDAKIFVVDKDIRFETTVNQNMVADKNGVFRVNFIGISQGLHSFGLLIKDKDNRITQTKFFNIDILASDLVVKDILVPPTIGFLQRSVSRGQFLIVTGNASPNNGIILEIDDIIKKEVNVEKDGSYRVAIDTGILEFGTHYVRVKQVDANQNRESDYSPINTFMVSRLVLPKADLSGDGVVNIKDWSVFLSNWGSKDENQKKIIDFNGDEKIDISDFSIFIRTIKSTIK